MDQNYKPTLAPLDGFAVLLQVASRLLVAVGPNRGIVRSLSLKTKARTEVALSRDQLLDLPINGPMQGALATVGSLSVAELQRLQAVAQAYDLTIGFETGEVQTMHGMPVVVLIASTIEPSHLAIALAAVDAGLLPDAVREIFSGDCQWLPPEAIGPHAVDDTLQGRSGILLKGWISQIWCRDVIVFSEKLSACCAPHTMLLHERPDVQAHLEPLPVSGGDSIMHGFLIVLPTLGESIESIFVFERVDGRPTMYGPFVIKPRNSPTDALVLLLDELDRQPSDFTPQTAADMLRSFMPQAIRNGPSRSMSLGPHGHPRVSIIVPLSGQPIFLFALLEQQERWASALGVAFQWVFVVTRLSDYARLGRLLSLREPGLIAPATLVIATAPWAFGTALNCGVNAAHGEFLCFLHESSWLLAETQAGQAISAIESGIATTITIAAEWDDGYPDTGTCSPPVPSFLPPFCVKSFVDRHLVDEDLDWSGLVLRKTDWRNLGGFSPVIADPEQVGVEFSRRLRRHSRDFKLERRPAVGRSTASRNESGRILCVRRASALLDWCEINAPRMPAIRNKRTERQ